LYVFADQPLEPVKVLTPEEKEAKLKELEQLRAVKRREREEREKKVRSTFKAPHTLNTS
jgi:hypothetical protein